MILLIWYVPMAKLTLSVVDRVVSRAKRYAKQQGVSVSQMVEAYLDAVAEPAPATSPDAPILRALRGSLKKASVEAYKRHLESKYQ
uniref:Putative zinc-peptidase n=1 Tax=uncultured Acidobacteriota bacterium TaxID=171953 RepID=G9C5G8_9BACT|nr:putative zinc-peptidase [uncultured Acidobacteriota bacterium]